MGKVYQRSGTKYTLYWKCYHFIYLYIDTQNELVKECIIYYYYVRKYEEIITIFFLRKTYEKTLTKSELHVKKNSNFV